MILQLIDKYPQKFKHASLVISISPFGLNDGAKEQNEFSFALISKMSFFEQIKTFIPSNIDTILAYYKGNFTSLINRQIYRETKINIGDNSADKDFGFQGVVSNEYKEISKESWIRKKRFTCI
jgi:hypothetical protein